MSLGYWHGAVISLESGAAVTGENSSHSALHTQLKQEINISHGKCHWCLWVVTAALPSSAWLIKPRIPHNVDSVSLGCNPLYISCLRGKQMKSWVNAYCWNGHSHNQDLNASDTWNWQSLTLVVLWRAWWWGSVLRHSLPLFQRWNVEQWRNYHLQFPPLGDCNGRLLSYRGPRLRLAKAATCSAASSVKMYDVSTHWGSGV